MSDNCTFEHKIGVMSDTHGSLPAWRAVIKLFAGAEMILHAGDVLYHGPRNPLPHGYTPADLADAIKSYQGTLHIARGNCDAAVDQMVLARQFPASVALEWHGRKIFMMHGDDFPLFRQLALNGKADLAISGHTHVASVIRENGTIFLNPGSTTLAKGRDPESAAIVTECDISIVTLDGGLLYSEKW